MNNGKPKECRKAPAVAKNGQRQTGGGQCPVSPAITGAHFPPPLRHDTVNNNSENVGGELIHPLRARLSAALQQSPKICVEAEVDRLVGAARGYCEKEKFKLKQHYEEELRRTKKTVIQEFKCAMEKEVIAPLKTKLCSYEREVNQLKKELGNACQYQRSSYEAKDDLIKQIDKSQLERDLLHAELDRAHTEKSHLQIMIKQEVSRKSLRASTTRGSVYFSEQLIQEREGSIGRDNESIGHRDGSVGAESVSRRGGSIGGESVSRRGGSVGRRDGSFDGDDIEENYIREHTNEGRRSVSRGDGYETGQVSDMQGESRPASGKQGESRPTSGKQGESRPTSGKQGEMGQRTDGQGKTVGGQQKGTTRKVLGTKKGGGETELLVGDTFDLPELTSDFIDGDDANQPGMENIHEDTTLLLAKIKELTIALDSAKKFTEEEIADLIAEGEIIQELQAKLAALEAENAELKRRLEALLKQLELTKPPRGSAEEENRDLRKRIQELEYGRSKASLQAELGHLKKQLEEVEQIRDEEIEIEQLRDLEEKSMVEVEENGEETVVEERDDSVQVDAQQSEQKTIIQKQPITQMSKVRKASNKLTPDTKQNLADETKQKSFAVDSSSAPRKSRTSIFEREILELKARIRELEDQLEVFGEMEQRIKELEAGVAERDALKKRLSVVSREMEEIRAQPPAKCPAKSDTENLALKARIEELEALIASKENEYDQLLKKANGLEAQNAALAEKIKELQVLADKAAQLEALHNQLLEEKRRKQEESNSLAFRIADLEKEKNELARDLEEKNKKVDDLMKELAALRMQNSTLMRELQELKNAMKDSQAREDELKEEVKNKNIMLDDLMAKVAANEAEKEALKKQIQDLEAKLGAAQSAQANLEAEIAHVKRMWDDDNKRYEAKLAEQARKFEEESSAMSKKGQCIMEHEKRCLLLTDQLKDDNIEMQERIRLLEGQLEAFTMMENRTKTLHTEMEELQRRAAERSKELDHLGNLPSTCELGPYPNMQGYTLPWQTSLRPGNTNSGSTYAEEYVGATGSTVTAVQGRRRSGENSRNPTVQKVEMFAQWPRFDLNLDGLHKDNHHHSPVGKMKGHAHPKTHIATDNMTLKSELHEKLKEIDEINRQLSATREVNHSKLHSEISKVCQEAVENANVIRAISQTTPSVISTDNEVDEEGAPDDEEQN